MGVLCLELCAPAYLAEAVPEFSWAWDSCPLQPAVLHAWCCACCVLFGAADGLRQQWLELGSRARARRACSPQPQQPWLGPVP